LQTNASYGSLTDRGELEGSRWGDAALRS
jgi:hypothetical protein